MPAIVSPLTTFEKTISRSISLLDLQDAGTELDEENDLTRSAVILAVAAFDRYFTAKYCDVLIPHLKDDKKISDEVLKRLEDAGLNARFSLELLASDRPFRKIRTIVQNSLSKYTTQRFEVIDDLFLAFGLNDLCECSQKKAKRKNLLTRINKLVELRNDIAHDGHTNVRGDPKAISSADVRARVNDLKLFVENCDHIVNKRFGLVKPVSA
ncbi:HEPN domain-containing protein [uncultured Roseovarius sp.]|uniref:HEPN domain-containing protein n=1 Tax=uncultured Roseovarius sp. TaxID=293344 RepID=UPI0025D7DE16|nr:HEPN domain-containing protein [uncultured Roseovarius sp.]